MSLTSHIFKCVVHVATSDAEMYRTQEIGSGSGEAIVQRGCVSAMPHTFTCPSSPAETISCLSCSTSRLVTAHRWNRLHILCSLSSKPFYGSRELQLENLKSPNLETLSFQYFQATYRTWRSGSQEIRRFCSYNLETEMMWAVSIQTFKSVTLPFVIMDDSRYGSLIPSDKSSDVWPGMLIFHKEILFTYWK